MNDIKTELEFYKLAFNYAKEIMLFMNEKGEIIKANKEALREYGYSLEEICSHNVYELIYDNNREDTSEKFHKALQGSIEFETFHRRKDHTKFLAEVKAVSIELNNTKYVMSIIKNITHNREIEEKNRNLASIVENSQDAIVLRALDGMIISWNKGAEKLYGYTKEEVVGKPIAIIFPEENISEVQEITNKIVNNIKVENYKTTLINKNGSVIIASISCSPIYDSSNKIIGIANIARDITEKEKLLNELEESERKWRFALEGGNFGVWDWNIETNYVFYSPKWKSMLGYEDEEINSTYEEWTSRIHKEDYELVMEKMRRHFIGEEYVVEYRIKFKNGNYKWVRNRGKVIEWSTDHRPLRMIGTNEDINDEMSLRKKIQENENRLRGIYDTMNTGIALGEMIYDEHNNAVGFRFLHMNKSMENIKSLNLEKWQNVDFYNGSSEEQSYWFNIFNEVVSDGISKGFEKHDELHGKYFSTNIYSPNPKQFAIFIADITVSKQKEQELIERYEELSAVYEELTATEEELRTNYESLEEANEIAEKANRAKSQFLANMSHELRTPLNGILGFTQLLQLTELNNEQREDLSMVEYSSKHLLEVINDILDLSKIESGKINIKYEKLNIKDIIDKTVKELSVIAQSKGLEVLYYVDPLIEKEYLGDTFRIKQILFNIINNAIKFTEQGHIHFKVKRVYKTVEETKLEFSVEDTGKGISEDFNDEIFEIFTQEEASYTKKYGGTGLGLAISKELVNLMKGDIWFKSEINKGSTFYFTVVLKNINNQDYFIETKNNLKIEEEIHKMPKILVVEDNEINCKIESAFLKQLNYEYALLHNGKEAVDFVEKNKIDIVLMDIQMPILDGYEATKVIRKMDEKMGKHTTIIAMTAYAMQGDKERFIECGMDDYISKPFGLGDLKEILEKYL